MFVVKKMDNIYVIYIYTVYERNYNILNTHAHLGSQFWEKLWGPYIWVDTG